MHARHTLTAALLALVAPVAASAQTPASNVPLRLVLAPAFHVTVGFAHAGWSDGALSGADGVSLTASRHVVGPVWGVFDFATLSGNTLSGSGVAPARHYLAVAGIEVAPDLRVRGRLVQPEVGVGIGTMVSDPAAGGLPTRSQNAVEMSVGLDVGMWGPLTLGAHYRHVSLRLQDVAAPGPTIPRTAVGARIFEVGLGVRF